MARSVIRSGSAGDASAACAMEVLFISDLHLSADNPAMTELFVGFLHGRARQADALYILGDLFDAWIGDDDDGQREVESALAQLTRAGTACRLMVGNRDFLIGRRFAHRTGCQRLRDPSRIELGGEPVLLVHGDLLCIDDVPYQRFRRRVRNPLVQWLFLRQPLSKRRRIAADYRRKSAAATADKQSEIMDVAPAAVAEAMRRHRVRRIIHGHTHRPADHDFALDAGPARRHVLADWREGRGEVLVFRDGEFLRELVSPSPP
jgi:UDP-2,3-diacylglucosamine hydrolase